MGDVGREGAQAHTAAGTGPAAAAQADAGEGLVLAPFRGVRFGPGLADRLGLVTSPPYDVIGADTLAALRRADPHNVVRLILPESSLPDDAGRLFERWRREQVLIRDPEPVLYGYEQRRPDGRLQRGLLGAVGLRPEQDRVILPHEDVMAGPVAGRMAVMRACSANLEPILLSYDGGGAASQVLRETATEQVLATATAPDGTTHRLWAIRDADRLRAIAEDLRPRQALIADGHHRYAAYLGLQAERSADGRASGYGPSGGTENPWNYGLALLVDHREHPLEVAAIHRVVRGVGLAALSAALESTEVSPRFFVHRFGNDADAARRALAARRERRPHGRSGAAFLVTDGRTWLLLQVDPHAETDDRASVASTETALLHEVLLDRILGVPEERVSYVHDSTQAVRSAGADTIAVLLDPVSLETVQEFARRGIRMPRKSTSFGPKPLTGLVMRSIP